VPKEKKPELKITTEEALRDPHSPTNPFRKKPKIAFFL